jgi:hypothetical protein
MQHAASPRPTVHAAGLNRAACRRPWHTQRRTPSHGCGAPPSGARHAALPATQQQPSTSPLLRLPFLSSADHMRASWWEGSLQPLCQAELQCLLHEPLAPPPLLWRVDALLTQLHQAAALATHLMQCHPAREWRAAGAAVVVGARELEQRVCRDRSLYARVQAARHQLLLGQTHQKQSSCAHPQRTADGDADSGGSGDGGVSPSPQQQPTEALLIHLADQLLLHMQAESWHAKVSTGCPTWRARGLSGLSGLPPPTLVHTAVPLPLPASLRMSTLARALKTASALRT